MNKKILILTGIIIALVVIIIAGYFVLQKPPTSEITNFEQCTKAGYPVLETYPRQCKTPDGRKFREILKQKNTCIEQGGNVCSSSQTCSGSWLSVSDTEKCCSEECKDSLTTPPPPSSPPPTGQISPFGIMAAFDPTTLTTIRTSDKVAWAGEKFRDLGAKWSRGAGEAINWGLNEPELGKGYNWGISDEFIKKAYQNGGENYNHVIVISPIRAKGANSDVPSDKEAYFSNYVEALVERYDGDGIADYDPIIKVKYWQMDNEPFPDRWEGAGGTIDGYVKFAELTHNAIKKSDPNAKIILGTFSEFETAKGVMANFDEVIQRMKNKKLFDYVDTHYWSGENNYKIPVGEARSILDSNGYSNAKMVALEFGTWAERDGRGGTENGQAKFLIKGYIYNIAHGFSLINWNNLVEWKSFGRFGRSGGSMFNYMGLIADGENGDPITAGTPRLSYYTYKKMTETLEESDWNNIQKIQESNGIYVYKFVKQGKPIWVAWNDNAGEKSIMLDVSNKRVKITEAIPKYASGKDVTGYNSAFNSYIQVPKDGKATLILKDVPLFVEE